MGEVLRPSTTSSQGVSTKFFGGFSSSTDLRRVLHRHAGGRPQVGLRRPHHRRRPVENVPELIEKLIELASRHSFLKKQIPKAYYDLHEAVIKLRPSAEGAATGKNGTSTASTNTLSTGLSGRYHIAHIAHAHAPPHTLL